MGRWALGRAGVGAGALGWALQAAGRAAGRHAGRGGRAGRPAGRPVSVWCAQLGQVGCFGAPDSVFGLV